MRPDLEALRSTTAQLFNEANDLKARWAMLEAAQAEAFKVSCGPGSVAGLSPSRCPHASGFLLTELLSLPQRFHPNTQLSRLNAATSAQEYLSEQLVNAFLDGGGDDESFAKQYKEIRKVYHRRAVSLDKWGKGKVVWRT